MDQLIINVKDQCPASPHKIQVNLLEDLERYGQLNLAINQGQREMIELLLKKGAHVNRYPTFHALQTPLHSAVYVGDLEIVEKLLARGASVNAQYSCETPLTLAAKFRKYDIVDSFLIAKGLENCCNDDGISHFHIACMRNQIDVAKKLLMSNQNINVAVSFDSDYWPGFTPLHFAVQFQCNKTVKFLLSAGADITIKDSRSLTPLHLAHMLRNEQIIDMILLIHEEVFANPKNWKGLSHFHIACTRNNPIIFEHFMKLGVNLGDPIPTKTERHAEKTALNLAIYYKCTDIVRLILQSGIQTKTFRFGELGPIRDAYSTGNMEIINLLTTNLPTNDRLIHKLSQKLTKNERLPPFSISFDKTDSDIIDKLRSQTYVALNSPFTSTGCTVLHASITHGKRQVSEFLVGQGVNYIIQDIQGKSPLHLAFERNMQDLVDLMLKDHINFDQNPTDKDGISHLHIACARDNANIVEHFLKLGANVNSPVNTNATFWPGFTPLHFAAKFGRERVAEILLEYGATISINNASNLSAFDVAFVEAERFKENGALGVMKIILTFQASRGDDIFNDRGVSLLHLACMEPNSVDPTNGEFTSILKAYSKDINKAIHKMNCSWDGYTPLHFLMQTLDSGNYATMLIKMGADIFKQASSGDTPLHSLSAFNRRVFRQITIDPKNVQFLEFNYIGTKGLSIFHQACARADLKFMKYFLEHGVDPNYPSLDLGLGCKSSSPLHLVVKSDVSSSVDAVKLLLDYNVNPDPTDYQKNTPLHLMNGNSHAEIIDMLVSRGADVNALNSLHETPLMYVCRESNLDPEKLDEIIVSFLNNGADINVVDRNGETPLSINLWRDYDAERISVVIATLLTHVAKLKTADLFVNRFNKDAYPSLLSKYSDELFDEDDFDEKSIIKQCRKELEVMKQIHVDNCTTLHNILYQSPNKLAVTTRNQVFQQIVDSNDFHEKFPFYNSILELQLKKGQIRWYLLNESREPFSSLLGGALPRLCVEEVLQNLENQDLQNIIKSRRKLSPNTSPNTLQYS